MHITCYRILPNTSRNGGFSTFFFFQITAKVQLKSFFPTQFSQVVPKRSHTALCKHILAARKEQRLLQNIEYCI